MRLYVHMMACGSICTLLYIFLKRAFPCELPLRCRKVFLRINALLYLLPVPWLAAQVKGWLKLFLEKAGMVFPERTLSNITDTTSVWESILVFDTDKKLLYITGYKNWLSVIAGGTLSTGGRLAYHLPCYMPLAYETGGVPRREVCESREKKGTNRDVRLRRFSFCFRDNKAGGSVPEGGA